MTKKTSSDWLKLKLSQIYKGKARDWIRVSTNKETRVFKNKETGAEVMVTELKSNSGNGKLYNIKRTDIADRGRDFYVYPHMSPAESFQKKAKPAKTRGLTEEGAADKVMDILMGKSDEEITENLLKKSGKALANRFFFTLSDDENEPGTFEVRICPLFDDGYDGEVSYLVGHMLSSMGEVSEDLGTIFSFPDHTDPVALARELMQRGFILEKTHQEWIDQHSGMTPMMPRLQALMHEAAAAKIMAATDQPGVRIETDAAKNAAADRAVKMYMDDEDADVPAAMMAAAGTALANRHCFAINVSKDALKEVVAIISVTRIFEEQGDVRASCIMVTDYLLPKCSEVSASMYEVQREDLEIMKTPLEAAKYLQSKGFYWSRKLQDAVEGSLTQELSVLERPAVKAAPVVKRPPGPKA